MSEDVKKKVKEAIEKSGYPLELYVSSIIEDKYVFSNNQYYFDHDENVARTIDIYVWSLLDFRLPTTGISCSMAVECKKSEKNAWVFFETNSIAPSQTGQIIDHRQIANDDSEINIALLQFSPKLQEYFGGTVASPLSSISRSYAVVKIGQNISPDANSDTKDTIFEAMNQTVKFISYELEQRKRRIREIYRIGSIYPITLIYFPVIVFDGHMFNAKLSNNEIELEEKNHVIVSYTYRTRDSKEPKNFYIDVVKKEYFEQFLQQKIKQCDKIRQASMNVLDKLYTDASSLKLHPDSSFL